MVAIGFVSCKCLRIHRVQCVVHQLRSHRVLKLFLQGPLPSSPFLFSSPIAADSSSSSSTVPARKTFSAYAFSKKATHLLMARLIMVFHKITPSFDKSLLRLVGAEYHNIPIAQCTTHQYQHSIPPRFCFPALLMKIQNTYLTTRGRGSPAQSVSTFRSTKSVFESRT